MSFERLQAFVAALPDRVPAIAAASAPQIAAQLRADATTGRGNVPSYGKFGDAPIAATASGDTITVSAAGWVLDKAIELDQPAKWMDIIRENVRAEFGGSR